MITNVLGLKQCHFDHNMTLNGRSSKFTGINTMTVIDRSGPISATGHLPTHRQRQSFERNALWGLTDGAIQKGSLQIVTFHPGLGQSHKRVRTQTGGLLLFIKPVGHSPQFSPSWGHMQVQPTPSASFATLPEPFMAFILWSISLFVMAICWYLLVEVRSYQQKNSNNTICETSLNDCG